MPYFEHGDSGGHFGGTRTMHLQWLHMVSEMTMQTNRDAFEAVFAPQGYDMRWAHGQYIDLDTYNTFKGWQAAQKPMSEDEAVEIMAIAMRAHYYRTSETVEPELIPTLAKRSWPLFEPSARIAYRALLAAQNKGEGDE